MPFASRFFFAFVCFFRVLFDGRFASAVQEVKALSAPGGSTKSMTAGEVPDSAPAPSDAAEAGRDTVPDDTLDDDRNADSSESGYRPTQLDADLSEQGIPSLKRRSPPKPEPVDSVPSLRFEPREEAETEAQAATIPLRERGALMLLAMLQRDGRFVDFVQQEVTEFDDEQIGAAARVVHEGCRKALREHFSFLPVRDEQEGDRVVLAEGYEAQANKLVGNLSGKPPYTGTVQHRGWRVETFKLPQEVGQHDATIVAQAEIEL